MCSFRYVSLALVAASVWLLPASEAAAQIDPGSCLPGQDQTVVETTRTDARLGTNGSLFPFYGSPNVIGYHVDGVMVGFTAGLWAGGRVAGEPLAAGSLYDDFEFFPGPLGADGRPLDPSDCSPYDRIYLVTPADVAQYEAGGGASPDLADWPVALGAPVVDGDGIDGNYDLSAGDRPDVRGVATAFWLMNDAGNEHAYTGSAPMGIEVRTLAVFSGTDAYLRHAVTNKNGQTIEDFRLGWFVDQDLGAEFDDDYFASDSTLGLGYVYNADNSDEGGFGSAPPAFGVDVLSGAWSSHNLIEADPANPLRFPLSARELVNVLDGLSPAGNPIYQGGSGENTEGVVTRYTFTADPASGEYWSERNTDGSGTSSPPGDRRMMISSTAQTLAPGASAVFDAAFLYARGSSNLASATALEARSAEVQAAYDAGTLTLPTIGVAAEETDAPGAPALALRAYPNPATDRVTLAYTLPQAGAARLAVYDVLGREVAVADAGMRSADRHRTALDVSALPAGFYVAVLEAEGVRETARFTVAR